MFYFLTQYVQQVMGYSPLKAGFAFLPVSAVIVVVAQIASRDRREARRAGRSS